MNSYKKKRALLIKNIYPVVILFCALVLLGIGYAQVSDVNLNITGEAVAKGEEGIFITGVTYDSSNIANPSDSTITSTYLTTMQSTINLGNDLNSTITYKVTIRNNTDEPAIYNDAIYDPDLGYDNNDIEYIVNGITHGDILNPNENVEFAITFKYKDSLSQVSNSILNSYINFKFDESSYVARIGSTYYQTLSDAVNAVPTTNVQTKVELLKDTSEKIVVAANKNILFDFKNNVLSSNGTNNVIKNAGTITITNGTIRSTTPSNGAVNNDPSGVIYMSGGRIEMTANGGKQALYNDKGIVNISGTSYLYSVGNIRAAVQNVAGGTMSITGGTIIATNFSGLVNDGTMTIGTQDSDVNVNSLIIQGTNFGIDSSTSYNFYDGKIKGKNSPVNDVSKIIDIETGSNIVNSTEAIEGDTYHTLFLTTSSVHTVSFNPNGGTVLEPTRNIVNGDVIGTLPIPTYQNHSFDGWFTSIDGGSEISASTIINDDITFYAHWSSTIVARVNGTDYNSVQEAFNNVPSNGEETTVTILKNVEEKVTVDVGKNIDLDLQSYTFKNYGDAAVIENKGTIKIKNGNFTSNADTSLINNNNGGRLIITGGRLIATGTRQAIYNNAGGIVEISGDAYLSSTTTGVPNANGVNLNRATVQNLKNGTISITGGTIIGINQSAISNEGVMTIGIKDGIISTTSPIIRGNTYGIESTKTLKIYDGKIMGITGAISGTVNEIETNSQLVDGTEVINNNTYFTKHLENN